MDQQNSLPAQYPYWNQNLASHHSYHCNPFYSNPPICQKCEVTTATIAALRTKVAVLETELKIAQAEKNHADHIIRYLLSFNAASNLGVPQPIAHRKPKSTLVRSIHRAEAERKCTNRMLKQVLKSLSHIFIPKHASSEEPSVQDERSKDTEHLTTDLLGMNEVSVQEQLDDLFPSLEASNSREDNDFESSESQDAGSSDSTKTSLTSEPDRLSESSYIFHFSPSLKDPSQSSDSDKVMLINPQKAPRATSTLERHDNIGDILGSLHDVEPSDPNGSITEVNTTSAESKVTETVPREWRCSVSETTAAPVWSCNVPLILGPPIDSPPEAMSAVTSWNKFAKNHTTAPTENEKAITKTPKAPHTPIPFLPITKKPLNPNPNPSSNPNFHFRPSTEILNLGICYNPPPGSWNTFRTVIISNIPPSTTASTLLSHVRGGIVVDFKLLPTTPLTGTNTALLTFLHQRSAATFTAHAKSHPLIITNYPLHITHSPIHTHPLSPAAQHAYFSGAQTRCLRIRGLANSVSLATLRNDFNICGEVMVRYSPVESIVRRVTGAVDVGFLNIGQAVLAKEGFLGLGRKYRGCVVRFGRDPCAGWGGRAGGIGQGGDGGSGLGNGEGGEDKDVNYGRLSKVDWE